LGAPTDRYGDPLPEGALARLGTLRFRHEGNATALLFSRDGKSLIGYTNSGIVIWNTADGTQRYRLRAHMPMQNHDMDLSPDGTTLAVSERLVRAGGAAKVSLWDLQSGTRTRTLSLPKSAGDVPHFGCLRFSPDGKSLAAGCGTQDESKVFVFDL